MPSFNKVILMGHLTRDPELRYSSSGNAIGRFGVAVNRTWADANGELKEEVTFVDVDCFGKTAETVSKHFTKGRPIHIEGRLKLDTWEDKNTHQKQSKLKVVLESFCFIDSRAAQAPPASDQAELPTTADLPAGSRLAGTKPAGKTDPDDDVPF